MWPFTGKRQQARPLQAKFDLAQTTADNRNHWSNSDNLSARAAVSPAVRKLVRSRSRYESENNSWYAGILRTVVNHVCGNGPRLQLLTADPAANQRIERAFTRWAKSIDFADKLRVMVEAYWRDGEVFAMRSDRLRNYPMTLDVRTFEADQVATPWYGAVYNNPFVDDGIRFDQSTNEIDLYVYDHHPGSNVPLSTLTGNWYSSREVLHLFRAERPGQTRGVPRVTPALQTLPIMRRQELATLFSAETAANFAMYLKSTSPAIDPSASPADFAEIELARNMLTTLPAGWDLGQVKPEQPITGYNAFQMQCLQSFSRCTNMPYTLAAGTGKDANFSSFKGDMKNVWEPEVQVEQSRVEFSIVEPIFRWFLESAVYVPGLLDGLPAIEDIDHRWHWPPLPELDAVDSANAAAIRMSTGQSTPTDELARRGQDWETESNRAASDFGVDVATYKAAVFAKTFGLMPGQPIPGAATTDAATATPAATAGAFVGTKRRDFANNQKATVDVLTSMNEGTSEVLTKASLMRLGWSAEDAQFLIDDARDGSITSRQLDPLASQAVPA